MTEIQKPRASRRGAIVARYDRETVPIVGTPAFVANALRTQQDLGRLLTDPDTIRPRQLGDGRVKVTVELLVPQAPATRREQFARWRQDHPSEWRWTVRGTIALAALAVIVALALAVAHAVAGILTAATTLSLPVLVGAGVALTALIAWLRTKARATFGHTCETIVTHRCHH